jgi:hypothetical protein
MLIFACPIIANSQCWLFALRANIRICSQISVFESLRPLRRYRKLNTGANTDIWGQIRIFSPYLPWGQITNTDCLLLLDIQKSDIVWYIFETRFETKIFASWTKATLLRIYFRNLSVHRSFLLYKSQCLEKINVKYVIKDVMHIFMHHLSLYFDI